MYSFGAVWLIFSQCICEHDIKIWAVRQISDKELNCIKVIKLYATIYKVFFIKDEKQNFGFIPLTDMQYACLECSEAYTKKKTKYLL